MQQDNSCNEDQRHQIGADGMYAKDQERDGGIEEGMDIKDFEVKAFTNKIIEDDEEVEEIRFAEARIKIIAGNCTKTGISDRSKC